MRIGIDVRCLAEGRRTGVEEYVLGLLPAVFKKDKENEYILFFNSYHDRKIDFSWANFPNVKIKKFSFPNKLLNFSLWYLGWPKIDRLLNGVDVFFAPNISFVALSKKAKFYLTIHDLSFERYSHFFSGKRKLWHLFISPKKLAKQADKILVVSESTKRDLEDVYGIVADKIEVIPDRKSVV
jgi:glycosyltransferase involved in cell wall biosynthesis